MGEENIQFEHKWLFVIIPVQPSVWVDTTNTNGHYTVGQEALFAAYCKHCDKFFTTALPWDKYNTQTGTLGLPRFGCVGPEGRF